MNPTFWQRSAFWLIILLTPALLVLGSIRLVMTETHLYMTYTRPSFPPDPYGFTREDRLNYAPVALRYLLSSAGPEYLNQVASPDGEPFYNARELQHMVDVKGVVSWAMLVLAFGGPAWAGAVWLLWRSATTRPLLRRALGRGGLWLLGLLAALVIYILLDWNHFFDSFHRLFFAEGSWQFFPSDRLIRLFPIRFWQDTALTVGGLSAGGALILVVFCRRIR